MKLIPTAALLLVLAAPAFAASPVKTLPGDITLAQAQAVVRSAQAKAEAINVPMNIAVVDAGGNLKAFARMDDAFLGSIDIAERKARTARYFNMSTRALGKAAQPGQPLYGIEATNGGHALRICGRRCQVTSAVCPVPHLSRLRDADSSSAGFDYRVAR